MQASLELIDDLERRIDQIERWLRRSGADHRYIPLLMSAPGIGWVTGFTIASEIGDITRFSSPVKLTGYTGLCPHVRQSGEMDRRGPLSKQSRGALRRELCAQLRSGRRTRRPRGRRAPQGQGRVREMVMISERPAEVEDRAVPGHWEGDLLLGKRPTGIATLVERTSRFTQLVALPDGYRAEPVWLALRQSICSLPVQLRRSLTWDQGKEMAEHARFTVDSGVQVYFCDPRSPWQRGSNENTNGLLRQYFPKRGDLGGIA